MRNLLRRSFSTFFVLAGINHFIHPEFYLAIMPPYFPAQALLVQVSGVAEILLGGMLMFERWRRLAGWGIIALLLAIFPANVHMALHPELFPQFTKAMLMIRLPIQGILIAWAYGFTRPGA